MSSTSPYRENALTELSSPDQLDRLMRVCSPTGWAALLGAVLVIATLLIWGYFGEVVSLVRGEGILMYPEGLARIHAHGSGQISTVKVRIGDRVATGQTLAELNLPELELQLYHARRMVAESEDLLKLMTTYEHDSAARRKTILARAERNLDTAIEHAQQRRDWLERIDRDDGKLHEAGLLSEREWEQNRQTLQQTREDIDHLESQRAKLQQQTLVFDKDDSLQYLQTRRAVKETARELSLIQERIQRMSRITSPSSGRILEVNVRADEYVEAGQPLFTLEPLNTLASPALEAMIFIPPAPGQKIDKHDQVLITPAVVRKAEFGSIRAEIKSITPFPVSHEQIEREVDNPLLAARFSRDGAPLAVRVRLLPDTTPSGYLWTASKGPPFNIESGNLCSAEVVSQRRRPIELVLPIILERMGWVNE